jgi:hypothetical protein
VVAGEHAALVHRGPGDSLVTRVRDGQGECSFGELWDVMGGGRGLVRDDGLIASGQVGHPEGLGPRSGASRQFVDARCSADPVAGSETSVDDEGGDAGFQELEAGEDAELASRQFGDEQVVHGGLPRR